MLVAGARRSHGVRFAGTGLAVGQNGNIVALEERAHAVANIFPDAILVRSFGKHSIKHEQLPTLRDIDRKTRR